MVKSVLGVNHQGLRDWMLQRLSAIWMVVYSVVIAYFFFSHAPLTYADWHALFAAFWMKVMTIMLLLFLLLHAWVGLWTVFTDYVKSNRLRVVLHTIVLLALIACFFSGLLIVWSV